MKRLCLLLLLLASPVAAQSHADVVAQVKASLLAQGMNLSGPCGAFQITRRVGWQLRNEGWGYVHSDGNGCDVNGERYRADTLMLTSGVTVDLLTRSESDNGDTSNPNAYNLPAWDRTGDQSPANWRAPLDPGGPVPPPQPPIPPLPPVPPAPPSLDLSGVYLRLDGLSAQAERMYADLVNRDTQRSAQIAALDAHLTAHDNEPSWLRKALTNPIVLGGIASLGAILTGRYAVPAK